MPRMSMGTHKPQQPPMWLATCELPPSPGHPFYARLRAILDAERFDQFAEGECRRFYAPVMGRPSLEPGRYFRLLLVGYFEGLDAERGIAWRTADSLAVNLQKRLKSLPIFSLFRHSPMSILNSLTTVVHGEDAATVRKNLACWHFNLRTKWPPAHIEAQQNRSISPLSQADNHNWIDDLNLFTEKGCTILKPN
jgi:hypothetical protein